MMLKINFVAHAKVMAGETMLPPRLKSTEIYYMLEGEGEMHINDEKKIVREGCLIYISPTLFRK